MLVEKILEKEEGFRDKPYRCSEGYVTIGYGLKLHISKSADPADFPISMSRAIARDFLVQEVAKVDSELFRRVPEFHLVNQYPNRKAIVVSMAYQMGVSGVMNFKKMWKAIGENDWNKAADEMLDSRWARQTPARANRHAKVMRSGVLSNAYK